MHLFDIKSWLLVKSKFKATQNVLIWTILLYKGILGGHIRLCASIFLIGWFFCENQPIKKDIRYYPGRKDRNALQWWKFNLNGMRSVFSSSGKLEIIQELEKDLRSLIRPELNIEQAGHYI